MSDLCSQSFDAISDNAFLTCHYHWLDGGYDQSRHSVINVVGKRTMSQLDI